jgi:hypothetical protein
MIKWKPVTITRTDGSQYQTSVLVDRRSGEDILQAILNMPKAQAVSLQEGYQKATREFYQLALDLKTDESLDVIDRWVEWLSREGYHIQLTGSEYEVVPDEKPKAKPTGPVPRKITMRVGEHFIKLLTISTRPPIKGVKIHPDKAEILYETGETEMAFKAGEENGYILSAIIPEMLGNQESKIKSFVWAS